MSEWENGCDFRMEHDDGWYVPRKWDGVLIEKKYCCGINGAPCHKKGYTQPPQQLKTHLPGAENKGAI